MSQFHFTVGNLNSCAKVERIRGRSDVYRSRTEVVHIAMLLLFFLFCFVFIACFLKNEFMFLPMYYIYAL